MWLDERGHIDKGLQKQLLEESNYWFNVLQRLVVITLTLASCNLAFRGHREDVNSLGSGNFQSIVSLLARYDPILKDLMDKPEGSVRYSSPEIQNELISFLASKLPQHLLSEIRAAPFFAVIGDTTTDVSKIDQYSHCIRYVHFDNHAKTIDER